MSHSRNRDAWPLEALGTGAVLGLRLNSGFKAGQRRLPPLHSRMAPLA